MPSTLDSKDFQDRLQHLDKLLAGAEQVPDQAAKARVRQIVQAVLDLHGAGLERLLECVAEAGEAGDAILANCGRDAVVGGMLLLHGLHPLDVEERVRQALDEVAPFLQRHGGNVELVEVCDTTVRLRLEGNCHHCPSSADTMRQTVEEAIYGKAPEVTAIEVEGLVEKTVPSILDDSRMSLPMVPI
jgi:Fe-S cluster biogenesis protein NfuA